MQIQLIKTIKKLKDTKWSHLSKGSKIAFEVRALPPIVGQYECMKVNGKFQVLTFCWKNFFKLATSFSSSPASPFNLLNEPSFSTVVVDWPRYARQCRLQSYPHRPFPLYKTKSLFLTTSSLVLLLKDFSQHFTTSLHSPAEQRQRLCQAAGSTWLKSAVVGTDQRGHLTWLLLPIG